MRTILHLSDLHFGRVDPTTLEPLVDAAKQIRPDVTAISGDLTQRARRGQFRQAREFLEKLPGPRVVVPGNHDVPLYNVLARFTLTFSNYRRYISKDLEPFYEDGEIAVAGINTAHARTFKRGRVTLRPIALLRERLCGLPRQVVRFVVSHHPIDLPTGYGDRELVRRAQDAMRALVACEADVLLAGHLHTHHASGTTDRHRIAGHTALIVQAGTATSNRGRGQPNSFNVIRIERPALDVLRYEWSSASQIFSLVEERRFTHSAAGWRAAEEGSPTPGA